MSIPYTYLVYCKPTNQYYYGVRFAKGCHPSDLWITYFTSSKYIKLLIKKHGKDAFLFEVRKIFPNKEKAVVWEEKVIRRMKMRQRSDFINKSDILLHTDFRRWINNGK